MSWKRYILCVILCSVVAIGTVFAFTPTETWDASYEASPPDSEDVRLGAQRIRKLKLAIRERLQEEHNYSSVGGGTDDGTHKEGSARGTVDDTEPTTTPGGETLDDGRFWFDGGDGWFYVYNTNAVGGAAFEYIVDSDNWASLTNGQNFTGYNVFNNAEFKRLKMRSLTITGSSYTTDGNFNYLLCDATSNAQTINLETAVGIKGMLYLIKKIDDVYTNAVTVDAFSTQTIDGVLTKTLQVQHKAIGIMSDGANWRVVNGLPSNSIEFPDLYEPVQERIASLTIFSEFGGDGSDGEVDLGSGESLTLTDDDTDGIIIKQYTDVTLADGAYIDADSSVHIVWMGVSGTMTIGATSYISLNGNGGAGGAAGSAANGSAGANGGLFSAAGVDRVYFSRDNIAGSGGGGGGAADRTGGNGGSAGTIAGSGGNTGSAGSAATAFTAARALPKDIRDLEVATLIDWVRNSLLSYGGGGGGGAGRFDPSGTGGAGGNGGGGFYGEFNSITAENTDGSIRCDGADGSPAGLNSGEGGGGGGGFAIVLYKTLSGSGTLTAAKGEGSTAGNGHNGGDGVAGLTYAIDVDG